MKLRVDVTFESLNALGQGRLPGRGGMRVTGYTQGELEARLEVRPELLAPNGFLHAATVIALADSACGYACMAHLPDEGSNFTTLELKCNFLGTATEGELRVVARAAHLGRSTQVWDATVLDERDRTLALFRCTQMVLHPRR
jgi:1,4-dihydroxy-2-naphthoyl-CoA hydrolase